MGRSPHGERGLKYGSLRDGEAEAGRSPHGERGLKYLANYLTLSCHVALLMESVD